MSALNSSLNELHSTLIRYNKRIRRLAKSLPNCLRIENRYNNKSVYLWTMGISLRAMVYSPIDGKTHDLTMGVYDLSNLAFDVRDMLGEDCIFIGWHVIADGIVQPGSYVDVHVEGFRDFSVLAKAMTSKIQSDRIKARDETITRHVLEDGLTIRPGLHITVEVDPLRCSPTNRPFSVMEDTDDSRTERQRRWKELWVKVVHLRGHAPSAQIAKEWIDGFVYSEYRGFSSNRRGHSWY